MSTTDLILLKASLESKLVDMAAISGKRADIVIQPSADALDQVQFASGRDLAVLLLNRESEMYHRVRAALLRMEEGVYGICLVCEHPINIKRLQAVPWAERCLGCQEWLDV